jgi:hypothetical protein
VLGAGDAWWPNLDWYMEEETPRINTAAIPSRWDRQEWDGVGLRGRIRQNARQARHSRQHPDAAPSSGAIVEDVRQ